MSAAHAAPHELVRIKGVYAHLDSLLTGVDRLKRAQIGGYDVTAPLPRHEIEEILYDGRPSPVRWWTMSGAFTGVCSGFLIASMTHAQWPMINPGGKPTVSIPPFAIPMFEWTILFGCLFTLVGMMVHGGLPSFFFDKALQDPRFSDDRFGIVFTRALAADRERIVEILKGSDAVEVTVGDDTIYEVPNA